MTQQVLQDVLPITPAVIQWARIRAGFSLEDAKRTFKKIEAWENGAASPTYTQLEQMSEKFKCPVAVFFFPQPPDVPSVESSFRTLDAQAISELPRTVRGFLRKAQAMQFNLSELNDGKNPASRLITRDIKVSVNTPLENVAETIRTYLGVTLEEQSGWKTVEIALEQWRDVFARVGVFVFKDAFHANGYFGFCLYDDEFPIIYVNNSSAKSRQIFTLFHELGHLLFQTSGVDLLDDQFVQRLPDNEQKIEIICNGLASMVLVPDGELDRLLKGSMATRETAAEIANYFNVSREVIYRKMLDRGLIGPAEYKDAAEAWAAQMKPQAGRGNYYNNQFSYLGHRYIDLAFERFNQRRFDDIRLAEYLNIKPKNLPAFELKYAGGG